MRLAAALALAMVGARATAAAAGDATAAEPIQLVYSAPEGCPDDNAFLAEVQRRARAIRVTEPSARSFRVEITADGDGFRGRLEVASIDGDTTARDVRGATCDETVSALALVSALAIDGRGTYPTGSAAEGRRGSIDGRGTYPTGSAAEGRRGSIDGRGTYPTGSAAEGRRGSIDGRGTYPTGSAAEGRRGSIDGRGTYPTGSAAEGRRGSIDGRGTYPTGSAAEGRRGSIEERAAVVRVTNSEARRVGPLQLALGTGVEVDGGFAPAEIYTFGAFAALRRASGWQLRLGFARSTRGDVTMPEGDASFRWTIATLDACPLALTTGRWSAAPCAGFQGGVLTAIGSDVGMASSVDRPWLAPDASVRLRVAIGRFAIELAGMVAAPLIRDRFYIAPATTVDHVPAVTAGAQLALSVDLL